MSELLASLRLLWPVSGWALSWFYFRPDKPSWAPVLGFFLGLFIGAFLGPLVLICYALSPPNWDEKP